MSSDHHAVSKNTDDNHRREKSLTEVESSTGRRWMPSWPCGDGGYSTQKMTMNQTYTKNEKKMNPYERFLPLVAFLARLLDLRFLVARRALRPLRALRRALRALYKQEMEKSK